jgi:hypothetical protein
VGTGVRKLTVDSLTDALISATTDIRQIDRARLIGEEIRAVCCESPLFCAPTHGVYRRTGWPLP